MRSRLAWQLLWGGGWLCVLALAGSAATVTLGSVVVSGATASEAEAPEEVDPHEEEEEQPVPSVRVRAPIQLARNPFCPTCTDAEPPRPPDGDREDRQPVFDGARETQLPITVNATFEARLAPASFAVIHDNERGVRGPYFIGDELRPGVRLDSIGPGSILLSNNGLTEYALVDPSPPAEVKPPKEVSDSESTVPHADDSIACTGNTCTVKREFVDELLRDPSVLVGQGNVMPTTTADGRSGFRITGARKGTLPRMLGLRSGDVLVEVGGKEATIDELLSLRARFSSLDRLELGILRQEKPLDLTVVFDG